MDTPWGTAQTVDYPAEGIASVSTASHGGYKLSPELNRLVPKYMRREDGWYEEDVDWAVVVTVFPGAFPEALRLQAENTLRQWKPDSWERFYGRTIPKGGSRVKDEELFLKTHKDDYLAMAAWGDWHAQVPQGFVGVFAGRGGRTRTGQYPKDTAYFLVPADEYDERGPFAFVVNPRRHEQMAEIR